VDAEVEAKRHRQRKRIAATKAAINPAEIL
jgi:hypothetical protein